MEVLTNPHHLTPLYRLFCKKVLCKRRVQECMMQPLNGCVIDIMKPTRLFKEVHSQRVRIRIKNGMESSSRPQSMKL